MKRSSRTKKLKSKKARPATRRTASRKNVGARGSQKKTKSKSHALSLSNRERDEIRKSLAVLLKIPPAKLSKAKLDKHIRRITGDASRQADLVAQYLDQRREHLAALGMTAADEERYHAAEMQVLARLYAELRHARPSPTLLTQLCSQFALDARTPVNAPLRRIQIQRRETGYEVAVHPPGQVQVPSIPYPGYLVRNPFAIRLFNLLLGETSSHSQMLAYVERLLPDASLPAESRTTNAAYASMLEVDLEQQVVLLAGKPFPVGFEGAHFVHFFMDRPDLWCAPDDYNKNEVLNRSRVPRVFNSLPKPIKALFESKRGTGYRLVRARLAELSQKSCVVTPAEKDDDSP